MLKKILLLITICLIALEGGGEAIVNTVNQKNRQSNDQNQNTPINNSTIQKNNSLHSSQNKSVNFQQLKVYNKNLSLLYPTPNNQSQLFYRYGIVNTILFSQLEQFIISSDVPFVVIASTQQQQSNFRISGYSQSSSFPPQMGSKIDFNTQQHSNKYFAHLFITRTCLDNFTKMGYKTKLNFFSHDPNQELGDKLEDRKGNTLILSINLASETYCSSISQIGYLQNLFNKMYLCFFMVIIACLPVFPVTKKCFRFLIITVFVINVCGLIESRILTFLLINFVIYFLVCCARKQYYYFLHFRFSKELQLSTKSFFSITACYDFITLILVIEIFRTHSSSSYSFFLSILLYLQNTLTIMAIFHIFGQVIWLNRLKHLFWWTIIVWIIIKLLPFLKGTYLDTISHLLEPINQLGMTSFMYLYSPTIVASQAQPLPILFHLLMFPIAIYFIKLFQDNMFIGIVIMIIASIFSYSVAYWIIVVISLIIIIGEIYCFSGTISGIRKTWIDRNTLQLMS